MAIVKRCCSKECSWSKTSSDGERGPKSVNILLGCFFLINYNLGDSYLAYPYAFYHAGYIAAIPTLLLVTFMSTIAATWEVEVMARAQVGSVTPCHAPHITLGKHYHAYWTSRPGVSTCNCWTGIWNGIVNVATVTA